MTSPHVKRRGALPRRRGAVLIYTVMAFVALVGVCGLAVDFGRAQLCRAELQHAADAAARAGAAVAHQGLAAVRTEAKLWAQRNKAAGQAVTLTDADIELGNMVNGVFTPSSSGNAVKITALRTAARGNAVSCVLLSAVGASPPNLGAKAVAVGNPKICMVGIDSISVSGNGYVDSFDPRIAPYPGQGVRRNAVLASNGNISVSGNGWIYGEAHPGVGRTVTGSSRITGSTTALTAPLAFPPAVVPPGATAYGAVDLSNETYDVAAGDYYVTSLSLSNKAVLNFLGPVRIYCSGPINITGGTINTYQEKSPNLRIYVTNSSTISLSGQATLVGHIYAPQSALTVSGKANLYGSAVARTLTFTGSWQGGVHYDESAGLASLGTEGITLVQ